VVITILNLIVRYSLECVDTEKRRFIFLRVSCSLDFLVYKKF